MNTSFELRRLRACQQFRSRLIFRALLCAATFVLAGCGYAFAPPTPPPPNVTVTILPAGATLFLGQTQQFQATVTGDSNMNVTWEVSGVAGGSATVGTISASGLYTAPPILPSPPSVTVTAVSQVNPKDSASVPITLQDNIVVIVSPLTANV